MLPVCSMNLMDIFSLNRESSDLAHSVGCSELVATVLRSKGFFDIESMSKRLSLDLQECLNGLDIGPGSVETALEWGKAVPGARVMVYGDYDADGVCSSALAVEMARESGAKSVHYYIPHRQKEGYGVHLNVIKKAINGGIETLIVTDCGSKDVESIEYAVDNGMNVMVFDHHSVEGNTIDIEAFVNPQRGGSEEAKTLCATAVLWGWAFSEGILPPRWLIDRLDLVALSTVGDCVSMGYLNRALVREGITVLKGSKRPGLARLVDRLGLVKDDIDESSLAMKLVPCLNAAGRMDVADLSLSVILTGDLSSIDRLEDLNVRRKEISSGIATDIAKKLENYVEHVMYNPDWPVGLLSAIASRLCSRYSLGFALAAPSGKGIKGTLRVPDGGNAVEILSELDPLLDSWGGHPYAAGFSVSNSRWKELSSALEIKLRSIEVAKKPETVVDYDPSMFDLRIWKDLHRIGPFGQDNPFPCFFTYRDGGERLIPLGEGGVHAKIESGSKKLIAFNGACQHKSMESICGWVYRPSINSWRGRKDLQFIVEKIVTF